MRPSSAAMMALLVGAAAFCGYLGFWVSVSLLALAAGVVAYDGAVRR